MNNFKPVNLTTQMTKFPERQITRTSEETDNLNSPIPIK